jgi:hypothetical protein
MDRLHSGQKIPHNRRQSNFPDSQSAIKAATRAMVILRRMGSSCMVFFVKARNEVIIIVPKNGINGMENKRPVKLVIHRPGLFMKR